MRPFLTISLCLLATLMWSCNQECSSKEDCGATQSCISGKCSEILIESCESHADCNPDGCAVNEKCKMTQSCDPVKKVCIQDPLGKLRGDIKEKKEEPQETKDEPVTEPSPDQKEPVSDEPPAPIEENQDDEDAGPKEEKIIPEVKPPDVELKHKCSSFGECKSGYSCYPTKNHNLECQKLNRKTGSEKSFSEACTKHSDCESGICDKKRQRCSYLCTFDADCTETLSCNKISLISDPDAQGKEYNLGSVSICLSGGNECEKDKDCQANYACRIITFKGKKETRCRKKETGKNKELGYECFQDGECASGLCIQPMGICSKLCKTSSDCEAGYECGTKEVEHNGQKWKFDTCDVSPDGIPCQKPQDCSSRRSGTTCLPVEKNQSVSLRCQAIQGSTAQGKPCKKHTDCLDGICLPYTKTCSISCSAATDCFSGYACGEGDVLVGNSTGKVKYCHPSQQVCQRTSDCKKGDICTPQINDVGKATLLCHTPKTGKKGIGEECTGHDDCGSLFCLHSICSQGCSDNTDCLSGYECSSTQILRSGKVLTIKACQPPTDGLPCKSNRDCTKANSQWLCGVKNVGSGLENRCVSKQFGGRATGTACTTDSECGSGFCYTLARVCSVGCEKITDCPDALECFTRIVQRNGSSPSTLSICAKKECSGDLDCRDGNICQSNSTKLTCEKPNILKKAQGLACSASSECQSNICHPTQKICTSPCKGGDSKYCPLQYSCETTPAGASGLHLCIPESNTCVKNDDCKSMVGTLCSVSYDKNNRLLRTCQAPKGVLKVGQGCDPSFPELCQTGICDPDMKKCTQACSQDSHCPESYSCQESTFKKRWTIKVCKRCESNLDCPKNTVCQLNFDVGKGKTTKTCQVPSSSGKKNGETCDPTLGFPGECGNHACHQTDKVCSLACSAHRHCPTDHFCKDIPITDTISTKVCVKGKREGCDGDEDCLNNEICQVNINAQGVLERTCKTKTGLGTGASCDPSQFPGSCASHVCDPLTRKCAAVCNDSIGGCPSGTVCDKLTINKTDTFACIQVPKQCVKSTDCDAGTTCHTSKEDDVISTQCKRNIDAGKKLGEACTIGDDCLSGLCNPTLKKCVEQCQSDSHCTTSGYLCGKMQFDEHKVSVCVPSAHSCSQDYECPAKEPVCSIEINLSNEVITQCSSGGPGTKKVGETCNASASLPGECQNRFCDIGTHKCTQICSKDDDCPTGLKCLDGNLVNGKETKGCLPPVGTTCTKPTDCLLEHTCRVTRATTKLVLTCADAQGKDPGEACDPTKQEECKSRVCHPTKKVCVTVCTADNDCEQGTCKAISYDGLSLDVCEPS